MKERKVSQKSLENLKLGGVSRHTGKIRLNLFVLPLTKEWLRKHEANGNMSKCLDEVIRRIIAGELVKKPE